MPTLNILTVIVAYDIMDSRRRKAAAEYILDTLGGKRRTESVYEFTYSPPITPEYSKIITGLREIIDPDEDDRMYIWDINDGDMRRLSVHGVHI